MFDYTKAAVEKIKHDFNRLIYLFHIFSQIACIAYLAYAVITDKGVFWANVALLALSTLYFLFFLFVTGRKLTSEKVVKRIYIVCKRIIKLYTLVITIYGLYAATKDLTAISVLFAAFMAVMWLFQVIIDVLFAVISNRLDLFVVAIQTDCENLVKPVKSVGNFFKKLAGKEIEPEKEKSKNRLWLDKKVEETREEKKRQKAAEKEQKEEEKRQRKQAKIDAKNTTFLSPADTQDTPQLPPPAEEVFETPPLLETAISNATPKKKKRKKE